MAETYIEKLTSFTLGLKPGDIPSDVRDAVGYFLLDAIGVAIANRDKPFVRLQANAVSASTKSGKSSFIGHEETFVAEGAAQLNSATIHGSDFDATHLPSIMHTSAVILPAALAVAEEVGASGSELVAAIVAGDEVLIRMGLATMGAMHRLGFQSTAVCAPVAIAIMCGRLYGMPKEQIVSAAGLAASLGAGLRAFSDDGTWGKRVITGWACRAGLTAVALAREGYPGTPDALEKEPFGLYKAFVQHGGYELEALTRDLGTDWYSREIDIKAYPCSHGHHAFLDTARRAKRELGISGADVESVMLHVSSEARKWWFEPREKKYELANPYGARFSMPYTVSLVLEFGNLHDEQLDDPSVLEKIKPLALRVTPKIDDTLSNANPNRLPGTIEIKTKDGRTALFEGKGHAESGDAFKQAVMEKYEMNCATIEPKRRDQIAALVTALEAQSDLAAISKLIRL